MGKRDARDPGRAGSAAGMPDFHEQRPWNLTRERPGRLCRPDKTLWSSSTRLSLQGPDFDRGSWHARTDVLALESVEQEDFHRIGG
jgi:hypothetical protein